MIMLHNQKGVAVGQVLKDLQKDDVNLLGSNIIQTQNSQWQTVVKYRDTRQSFPPVYGFALCLHSAFDKDSPFVIELSEQQARQKLKSWNYSAVEIDKLIKTEVK